MVLHYYISDLLLADSDLHWWRDLQEASQRDVGLHVSGIVTLFKQSNLQQIVFMLVY